MTNYHFTDQGLLVSDRVTLSLTTSFSRNVELTPEYIIWHYTACSAAVAKGTFMNPESKTSAHFLVLKDGGITQFVPCIHPAWHAGRSAWEGRAGCNTFTLGIELENLGPLRPGTPVRDTYGRPYKGVPYMPDQPKFGFRMWDDYPEAQLDSAEWLAKALIKQYPTIQGNLGHSDIAPSRKIDPGPAFPMARFQALVEPEEDRSLDTPPPTLVRTRVRTNLRAGDSVGSSVLCVLDPGVVLNLQGEVLSHTRWFPVSVILPSKGMVSSKNMWEGFVHRDTVTFE